MSPLIPFWSHALAAAMFTSLLAWRVGAGTRLAGQRLLLAAFAVTACWAFLKAIAFDNPMVNYSETARNLVWIALLYSLSTTTDSRQQGVRLVYGAVAAVLGLQLVATTVIVITGSEAAWETARLLRITTAAGALVLVHNVYGQAAPADRSNIRFAMLGLALMWVYDLNLYTVAYLDHDRAATLFAWRGLAVALTGPLFALGARTNRSGGSARPAPPPSSRSRCWRSAAISRPWPSSQRPFAEPAGMSRTGC
jgi:hypothetical protein